MALTVKDILQLDGLSKMRLIAGEGGLDRYVVSLGIADNEFSSFADQSERNVFEADMIILSTLLFSKEEPVSYTHLSVRRKGSKDLTSAKRGSL